jgi:hypothetical protein
MNMFIIETSNEETWEINHGFHLVEAQTKELAIQITKNAIKEKVVDTQSLDEFMRTNFSSVANGKLKTIIESSTM